MPLGGLPCPESCVGHQVFLLELLWLAACQETKQAQRQLKAQRRAAQQQVRQAAAEANTAQAAKAAASAAAAAAAGPAAGKGPLRQGRPEMSQVRLEVSPCQETVCVLRA